MLVSPYFHHRYYGLCQQQLHAAYVYNTLNDVELNVLRETTFSSRHQESHQYGSGIRPGEDDTKFAIQVGQDHRLWFVCIMMAIREAIKENVLHASAPHAPYVSTA